MPGLRVGETLYASGTIQELAFGSGATRSLAGAQLAIHGFGSGGDTIAAGDGISVSVANGINTITNTSMSPSIIHDGVPQAQITSLAFNDFVTTTSSGALTITAGQGPLGPQGPQGLQ